MSKRIGVRFDAKDLINTLRNTTEYTKGFLTEVKVLEPNITNKISGLSIDVFYEYLDGLARNHPGMLHHVYEWGQVGDPFARLFLLNKVIAGNRGTINAEFLQSNSISETSTTSFYDKASVMEEGIPVVVNEKDARVLFFEIDGEEFFRNGPIYIANPGGSEVRGSFLKAFNEFYTNYFTNFYLKSIGFYKHFENPKDFVLNFNSAVKSGGASGKGKKAALSWIQSSPGDNI
jgi:hypothetical protein